MPGDYAAPCWLLRQARQLLYPRRCPFCRRVLGFVPTCPECAERLEPLRRMPMRLKGSEHYLGTLSGAAAPYRYTGCVRGAVLRAKYQGEPWTAVELGVEMARLLFGSEILMRGAEPTPQRVEGLSLGYDAIVPVPASSKKRGYNVPERMARPLAKAVGVPLAANALGRARTGRHQAGLSLDERLVNVAGAFRVLEPDMWTGSGCCWWMMSSPPEPRQPPVRRLCWMPGPKACSPWRWLPWNLTHYRPAASPLRKRRRKTKKKSKKLEKSA